MARIPHRLIVDYTAQALGDLVGIWEWNAKQQGARHADGYIAYLKAATLKLAQFPNPGSPVPARAEYRYAILKRRRKGYGHLVVFVVEGQIFRVLRYYHSSQDWQSNLSEESPF